MDERYQTELLEKIEHNSRRQARLSTVSCLLTLLAALCCGGLVLLLAGLLPQVNTILENLEQVTAQLAALDLAGLVEDVDTLVSSGRQSLEQLSAIDLETLNQAIADLAAVVEPLRKIFSVLS